ncbi:MAG: methyltransferase domain-containing protein [Acidimicrobiia bacterium]|nr:methyltransferase domain-containing protein [Acidimicrobiia bacterium]
MPVIGIVGAFDAADLGGLLFPLLAQEGLAARFDVVESRRYALPAPDQDAPVELRDLSSLADELDDLDLLLIGGGQLVGADGGRAQASQTPSVPGNLGLDHWAVPSLLGARAGVPVAWSALELSMWLPPWLAPLARAAVGATAYASVLDAVSAERFAQFTGRSLPVVPDPAFVLVVEPGSSWERAGAASRAALGVKGEYVLVQSAPGLRGWADAIDDLAGKARAEGCTVVELPISPAAGDASRLVPLTGPTVAVHDWPGPAALAGLIAGAAGVIGSSAPLAAVARANGVPVWRPPSPPGHSAQGADLPGVYELHDWGPEALGRREPAPEARALARAVEAQWDDIAAAVGQASDGREALLELIEGLPQVLGAAAHEVRVTSSGQVPPAGRGRSAEAAREQEGLPLVEAELVDARHVNRYRWAASLLPAGSLLDAGCGTATGAAVLATAGHEVTAVDNDTALLDAARALVPPNVALRHASIDALPFATGSFDAVVCLETLNLVEDVGAALDELRRVLAPGGHLVLSTGDGRDVPTLRRLALERFGWVGTYVQRDWYATAVIPTADAEQVSTVRDGMISARRRTVQPADAVAALLVAGDGPPMTVPAVAELTDTATVDGLASMLAERHRVAHEQLNYITYLERQRDEVAALQRHLLEAEQLIARVPQQRELIANLTDRLEVMQRQLEDAELHAGHHAADAANLRQRIEQIESSTSWRVSAPIRETKRIMNRLSAR